MGPENTITAAMIVAGGSGTRARTSNSPDIPKQYQVLAGKSVLQWTLEVFVNHDGIDLVLPVIAADAKELYDTALGNFDHAKLYPPITGGASRQQSVRNGLEALREYQLTHVLIHDAARPFIEAKTIDQLLVMLETHSGVIVATPVADTLKKAEPHRPVIEETVDRQNMWGAQTPQGFHFEEIRSLHELYKEQNLTDDAALYEKAGMPVAICPGSKRNLKITHAEDFDLAESYMRQGQYEYRTGQGFDVHRFEDGESIMLCGVEIPHTQKLKGHSDADVAMHALTDAILGAIGAGDIGTHFPPSDQKWQGAASEIFLTEACRLVSEAGGSVIHSDITIICESPKIGPHRDAMRARLSGIMKCPEDRISVKATTTEKLGFTGRREGISALATATVKLPES